MKPANPTAGTAPYRANWGYDARSLPVAVSRENVKHAALDLVRDVRDASGLHQFEQEQRQR